MKAITPVFAIAVIGAIEIYALSKGINGVALTATIATIAGIGGFKAAGLFAKPGNHKE